MKKLNLLLLLLLISFKISLILALPSIQCAQTGGQYVSPNPDQWLGVLGAPISIGAKKYFSKYSGAMFAIWSTMKGGYFDVKELFKPYSGAPEEKQSCPYDWNRETARSKDLCDEEDKFAKMRIYSVQQTDEKGIQHTLSGWLHIEVELTDPTDSIRMIYGQMNDEYFSSIGEFITNPLEQCAPSDPTKILTPTPYQYIPCNAIGAREPYPGNALFMVANEDLFNQSIINTPYLPPIDLKSARGFHFTWKLSEYWCSRHFRFRPEIFILSSHNIERWKKNTNSGKITGSASLGDHRLVRKMPNFWLRSQWFGAADIKHPAWGSLQCNNLLVDPVSSVLSGSSGWIKHKHENVVKEDYDHWSAQTFLGFYQAITCQPSLNGADESNFPTFAGRCKSHRDPDHVVSPNELQSCNTNKDSSEFQDLGVNFTKYTDYKENLSSRRNESCFNPCRGPNDTVALEEIKNFTGGNGNQGFKINITGIDHETRIRQSIARFWRGRKFHAILWIFITMFLTPISFFLARYFKETFMAHQFGGIHIWYWVHVTFSLASVALMISSQLALAQGTESWGRSESSAGKIHGAIGWTSQAIFFLVTFFGGLRGEVRRNVRICSMVLHSSVGFLSYLLNLFLILVSTKIPGSPSLAACDADGLPTGVPSSYAIVFAWIIIDILFHVILTSIQFSQDKKIELKRPCYFPIIPILNPNSHQDMRLSLIRKLMLMLYLLGTTGFSLGFMLHLVTREQPKGCVFGEMSCKAALGCTSAALAVCKKLQYRNCEG